MITWLKRKIIYEIGDENLATSIISSTGRNKKIRTAPLISLQKHCNNF
jgi:hypothetical protein